MALYSHFSWSLQQPFNEYYSYLHFWNEQAGFRESCQLSQSWQVVNWYSNHMFAKWKRNNRWMEAAANLISFSACRSWLQRWTTLVWCPQWVKIFHSRGGLLDTSGRLPSKRKPLCWCRKWQLHSPVPTASVRLVSSLGRHKRCSFLGFLDQEMLSSFSVPLKWQCTPDIDKMGKEPCVTGTHFLVLLPHLLP